MIHAKQVRRQFYAGALEFDCAVRLLARAGWDWSRAAHFILGGVAAR